MSNMKLFSGSIHPKLAEDIASHMGIHLSPIEIKRFKDNEIYVRVKEKVRGDDIFLIQSLSKRINDALMELLIMIDAMKRASAGRINVIAPYLCYSRQDRKSASRESITAKLVANLITIAGADRIVTFDLHSDQEQGFYDIPLDHFLGYPIFAEYFRNMDLSNTVAVAPDTGAAKKTRRFAQLLNMPLAIIDKRRTGHNMAEAVNVIGEISGRNAILIDDMIDTGGTITAAADALKKKGAKDVFICATHPILSDPAVSRLKECAAKEVILLDTIPIEKEKIIPKMKILSVSTLMGKAIDRIHTDRSLGELFYWEK